MDHFINSIPYYRSTTKPLGKHLFFIDSIDCPKNIIKDKYLSVKNIEILKGTWAYMPIDTVIINSGKSLNIDISSLINMDALKDLTNLHEKYQKNGVDSIPPESLSTLPDDSYYYDLIKLIDTQYIKDYDTWYKLCYAMKKIGMSDKEIHNWSSKTDNYNKNTLSTLLKNYKDNTWMFGKQTIKHYAKVSDPFKYSDFIIDYKKLKLKPNDFEIATYFLQLYGDSVLYVNDIIYVYDNDEWRSDEKSQLLKVMVRKGIDKEATRLMIKLNQEKINNMDNAEELSKEITQLNKVPAYIYDHNKLSKIARFITDLLKQRKDDVIFDVGDEQKYNIHYNNGVFDILTKKFRKRTKDDYITQKLNYDYFEVDEDSEEYQAIETIFKKLQPNIEHCNFEKDWLALCLTGDTSHQKFKCNIGYKASNGKSTLLSIHDRVFPIYTCKLDAKTFNKDYSKSHKQFAQLLTKPIRLAYIEELDRNKLDSSLLKDFVDGEKLPVEILYSTTKDAKIQAKLNTNSNKDFNIDGDKGVLRRGLVQYFNSVFDEKNTEDDYENHNYICDMKLKMLFDSVIYKNAYRQILMDNFKLDRFKIPSYAEENFEEILDTNDTFGDILQLGYEITRNEEDMESIYNIWDFMKTTETYSKIDKPTLIQNIKTLGLIYDRHKRLPYKNKPSVKNAVVGLKMVESSELEETQFPFDEDHAGLDSGVTII